MKVKSSGAAKIILVLANMIPLAGVVFFGWNLFSILLLYWLENVVVGLYTMLRIKKADLPAETPIKVTSMGKTKNRFDRAAFLGFFFLHYGMFTAVHGVFVFSVFRQPIESLTPILVGVISLLVSHGVSHYTNFIGLGEYKKVSFDSQMWAPYKRVFVMHITIILGGFFVQMLGAPIMALVVLVVLKTLIDLGAHIFEHKKLNHNDF